VPDSCAEPAWPAQGPGWPALPGAPEPATDAARAGLAALMAQPSRALIALDFDGTLSPITGDAAAARSHPRAVPALRALAPLAGTLAVITGRPAAQAVELGGLDRVPGLIVLGIYGRQRWQDGRLSGPPPPPGLQAAREQLPALLAAAGAAPGTWTEDKGDAVAVHTRRAAAPAQALAALRGPLAELAKRAGLVLEPGRLVLELRPPGPDKGQALTDLVRERESAATLYCGDDLGDVPAFRAVARLRREGIPGVTVCSGSAEVPELARLADLVVDGPEGVVGLLGWLTRAFTGSC
jgi:trehalose 6-phosphate phosphatase